MGKRRGIQKGAQQHAEGAHGPKTQRAHLEQLQSGTPAVKGPDQHDAASHDNPGGNRLFERRDQHDHAEKNSEKNRIDRDIRDHGHVRENFQVRGGAESHPAMPRSRINPGNPDEPNSADGPTPDESPARVPGTGAE